MRREYCSGLPEITCLQSFETLGSRRRLGISSSNCVRISIVNMDFPHPTPIDYVESIAKFAESGFGVDEHLPLTLSEEAKSECFRLEYSKAVKMENFFCCAPVDPESFPERMFSWNASRSQNER